MSSYNNTLTAKPPTIDVPFVFNPLVQGHLDARMWGTRAETDSIDTATLPPGLLRYETDVGSDGVGTFAIWNGSAWRRPADTQETQHEDGTTTVSVPTGWFGKAFGLKESAFKDLAAALGDDVERNYRQWWLEEDDFDWNATTLNPVGGIPRDTRYADLRSTYPTLPALLKGILGEQTLYLYASTSNAVRLIDFPFNKYDIREETPDTFPYELELRAGTWQPESLVQGANKDALILSSTNASERPVFEKLVVNSEAGADEFSNPLVITESNRRSGSIMAVDISDHLEGLGKVDVKFTMRMTYRSTQDVNGITYPKSGDAATISITVSSVINKYASVYIGTLESATGLWLITKYENHPSYNVKHANSPVPLNQRTGRVYADTKDVFMPYVDLGANQKIGVRGTVKAVYMPLNGNWGAITTGINIDRSLQDYDEVSIPGGAPTALRIELE